ncbi:DUF1080 domain-containing protein [Mucilaginibacter sp. 21P]|uniref:3-keto-disaccharide hydrolase n=1 Tax=Mucilaginibacter sp. 21P TaxID=2778902 RepID=UPI001C58B4C0|nr:DUF1080 domain-containing protein [Mucilaginibacter sp. 21P]QXV64109.1 DUF1080 domain-containing protein [Mucilaginibacter sp. 21P]
MKHKLILTALLCGGFYMANAQNAKPEDTEKWEPVPPVVKPGKVAGEAPSDAIILFNGKTGLSEWVDVASGDAAKWDVKGDVLTVNKKYGNIETKKKFGNYQLHIEWKVPSNIEGTGQARGNSGVFLASIGKGDDGYELQVLDSYNNKTYVNGMAGSIYKQFIPLANPTTPPGTWNVYDVIWTAPTFDGDQLKTPARVTVIFNGVLVENNVELMGPTQYIGKPGYRKPHGDSPIKLQAHGDKSEPLSFRNIWVREIK